LEQQYEQVVARVLPSVVQISTSSGFGSGVVYDTRGDIVTNAHVVGTATTLQVGLASGGKPLAAEVVGVFAPDDLAVIKVTSGAITAQTVADATGQGRHHRRDARRRGRQGRHPGRRHHPGPGRPAGPVGGRTAIGPGRPQTR
jgi:hypothetical protein